VLQALDMAKTELFPSLTFTCTDIDGVGRADSATLPLADGGCGCITLICGDLFIALQRFVSDPFDIVYDRHSFGAISPEMRPRYASTIMSLLRQPSSRGAAPSFLGACAGLYFMQVAHRRDGSFSAGPPFHVTLEEVQKQFSTSVNAVGIEWSYGHVPGFSDDEEVRSCCFALRLARGSFV
jgi:hypothetical protein